MKTEITEKINCKNIADRKYFWTFFHEIQ